MTEPHILIIPPWFDIDFQHNFAQSYHWWARDLSERSEEVQVGLLYGEFPAGIRKRQCYPIENLNYHYLGVQDWGLPKVGPGWYLWEKKYLRAFQDYVDRYGRPTVIHGFSLLGLIAAGAIHRKHAIPFVYTEVLGNFVLGKAAKRMIRRATDPSQQASIVCGISPGMVTALDRTFGVAAKLISLYVDNDIFFPEPQRSGPPRFICIGAPARTKGMDILIEAMRIVTDKFPDAHLTLVDDIPERSWLESLIEEHQLGKHIEFTGAVSHEQIPELMHRSHVLVSASRWESLGMTILEALSCGRPVVATRTAGSNFILNDEMGYLVSQENPVELANAMIDAYDTRAKFKPEELHKSIQSRFGKELILGEWMDIYLRLSNNKSL